MRVLFPLQLDGRGHVAECDEERYVRQLIEQVLFTIPGERVNRPDIGAGLQQLLFAPNGTELVSSTRQLVQAHLQHELGEWIQVRGIHVQQDEEVLHIDVEYALLRTQKVTSAKFRFAT
jgi:phage baseplate assembly protein W